MLTHAGDSQISLSSDWPIPVKAAPLERNLANLATAKRKGLTRQIGASNFTIAHRERSRKILGDGEIATNQVEIQPFLQNRKLVDYCQTAGTVPTAYVPLAKGRVADDPVLGRIAERHGASASQIALA